MTVEELYKWAIEHDAEDCEIIVRDSFNSYSSFVEPKIFVHNNGCREVEL